MGTPIKLEGGSGDLKEMSTGEEAWLAYQCGLQLAASTTSDPGALTTSSAGNTNIGSYTNTFFNEAVGTHPGSSITSGSTTTTVYQATGTATEAGADFHRPIRWNGTGFEEMDDTELNTLVDRLLGLVFANSYPGDYYLASSSPGGTYDTHISSIFSDTRTDGTTVTYNIYQRQSIASPPSEVKCVKIFNDTTSFDGLKEMSNTEIAYTLGQRMKTRIMSSANNIGAYQLRSSAQGAPVSGGTWVSRGTATDTKNTTADVDYSAIYTQVIAENYIGNYTRDRTQNFVGNYTRDRTQNFVGTYTRDRTQNFVGNYTNPNAINYQRTRIVSRVTYYAGRIDYPYWIGNYVGDYLGPASYAGDYVGNFIGNYAGDYVANYVGNYDGDYVGNFIGNYDGDYEGNFEGNYLGNYLGETINSGTTTIETYTLYVRTA